VPGFDGVRIHRNSAPVPADEEELIELVLTGRRPTCSSALHVLSIADDAYPLRSIDEIAYTRTDHALLQQLTKQLGLAGRIGRAVGIFRS
jgi:hypothetical protein